MSVTVLIDDRDGSSEMVARFTDLRTAATMALNLADRLGRYRDPHAEAVVISEDGEAILTIKIFEGGLSPE